MDALTCLQTRRTTPLIQGPEPTAEQLGKILTAATLVPDHKLLRPWRFVVVRGEFRTRIGEALMRAAKDQNAAVEQEMLDKLRSKAMRAPLLVAIIASPKPGAKAPLWEQHASAAAAAQNICLAAHAQGLGSAWKSTHLGDAAPMRALFGMQEHENFFGWVELGQAASEVKPRERPGIALKDVVSEMTATGTVPYEPK